jgi:Tol biopolymer transport system component
MRLRSIVILGAVVALFALPTAASATMPGENGRILFSAETAVGVQMFTVRPSGNGVRQITHVDGDAVNPDWSPNGRRIVFAIGTETSSRIAIVRPDGSHLRVLPQPADVFDDQPSYSPNGQWIYFERYTVATNDDAIWRMKTDGSRQQRVLGPFPNGFVTDPNVSPDGRKLSFQGWDGSLVGPPPNEEPARGLFTARIDGTHITQIRPYSADETVKADWSPSGLRIAVTENANHFHPDDSANMVTMRLDGSHRRYLTHFHDGVTNAYLGSYSPDGRWLVYRLEKEGLFGLYRIHPDGTGKRVILPLSEFRPRYIDWGPETDD